MPQAAGGGRTDGFGSMPDDITCAAIMPYAVASPPLVVRRGWRLSYGPAGSSAWTRYMLPYSVYMVLAEAPFWFNDMCWTCRITLCYHRACRVWRENWPYLRRYDSPATFCCYRVPCCCCFSRLRLRLCSTAMALSSPSLSPDTISPLCCGWQFAHLVSGSYLLDVPTDMVLRRGWVYVLQPLWTAQVVTRQQRVSPVLPSTPGCARAAGSTAVVRLMLPTTRLHAWDQLVTRVQRYRSGVCAFVIASLRELPAVPLSALLPATIYCTRYHCSHVRRAGSLALYRWHASRLCC